MLAGSVKNLLLDIQYQIRTLPREQLDRVLRGLVGTKQAILLIAAAAVHRACQNIIHAHDTLCTCCQQQPLGACSRMNIAVKHILRKSQNTAAVIGKDDLCFRSRFSDHVAVIGHIIHSRKGMFILSEKFSVLLQRQHVAVGVDPRRVQLIEGDQFVTHFIAGITEHQHYLLRTLRNTAQADCKTVPGQNREDNADGLSTQLLLHILRDRLYGSIIALRPCHHGLGHRDHVPVANGKALCLSRL